MYSPHSLPESDAESSLISSGRSKRASGLVSELQSRAGDRGKAHRRGPGCGCRDDGTWHQERDIGQRRRSWQSSR